jgi:hypothetical protein
MIAKDFPLISGKSFAERKSFAIMTCSSQRAGPIGIMLPKSTIPRLWRDDAGLNVARAGFSVGAGGKPGPFWSIR